MDSSIKNIILDFGGVLLDIDYKKTEQHFIQLGCINFEALYSKATQTSLFDDFEKGLISETVFFQILQEKIQVPHVPVSELKSAWNAMLIGFRKETYQMLQELKKEYRLFLLSNTNETHIQAFEKMIEKICPIADFESLFEQVYYSCRIQKRKPDAACFKYVLQHAGITAKQTLFIDDSIQHVQGAKQIGLAAHHLTQTPLTGLSASHIISSAIF